MQILPSIPAVLAGRGHNECTPIQCECGEQFLFGLSDGTKRETHNPWDSTIVKCPTCKKVEGWTFGLLTPHNGQVKGPHNA